MDRFDIYRVRREQKGLAPYLVVLSAPHLSELTTVVVAPLVPLKIVGNPIRRLQPVVDVNGLAHVLVINDLLSIPRSLLGQRIGSIEAQRFDVVTALDFLFQGY